MNTDELVSFAEESLICNHQSWAVSRMLKYICVFYQSLTLEWHRLLNLTFKQDTNVTLHRYSWLRVDDRVTWNHACWWPGDPMYQTSMDYMDQIFSIFWGLRIKVKTKISSLSWNAYELLNLRAFKISMLHKIVLISFNVWVKYFVWTFKGHHTKYLTHTLKDVEFI